MNDRSDDTSLSGERGPLRLRGQMVTAWHPDSPGSRVTVWRPWWRRKRTPFATLGEVLRAHRSTFDATRLEKI